MRKEKKEHINRRKIAFVYLMHRMFDGNPAAMIKILCVPKLTTEDLLAWDADYRDAVKLTIQEEDSRGVQLKDDAPVPTIKSIKEKTLRRIDVLINATEDPARLGQVYKTLSEFENADDKKEKGVIDAISDSIKPAGKKAGGKTMVEKMRSEVNGGVNTPGRKRGRPRKVEVAVPLVGPDEEETEQTTEEE